MLTPSQIPEPVFDDIPLFFWWRDWFSSRGDWMPQLKTASHHLDKGSILKMVISSLEECIMHYVPQVLPPKVDSI